jgi:hypothetical protein
MQNTLMQRRHLIMALMIFGSFRISSGLAAPNPDVEIPKPATMQQLVWNNMRLLDYRLEGALRTEESLHPITLRTLGRIMVYEFKEKPLQIRVCFLTSGSIIWKRHSATAKWEMLEGKSRLAKILDSDITYEDLGVDFIRWSTVKPVGGDSILTLNAWAYEAVPPIPSNYAKLRFWVSAQHLALLRADAFNSKGQAIKRVQVNGVMKVGEGYVMKEMVMKTLRPGTDVSISRSFIEIRSAHVGSGLSRSLEDV